jgi:hypothetical protein
VSRCGSDAARRRSRAGRWLGVAALLLPFTNPAPGADTPSEYQAKAAVLLNVARFTEWPATAFRSPEAPIEICVLGENPFGETLSETIRQETAGGRPLRARTIDGPSEARPCHLLFVPRGQARRAARLLARPAPLVTVGESADFLAAGGTINLFLEDGLVRFAVNQEAAARQGVRFSSHLLRLAREPNPRRPE